MRASCDFALTLCNKMKSNFEHLGLLKYSLIHLRPINQQHAYFAFLHKKNCFSWLTKFKAQKKKLTNPFLTIFQIFQILIVTPLQANSLDKSVPENNVFLEKVYVCIMGERCTFLSNIITFYVNKI